MKNLVVASQATAFKRVLSGAILGVVAFLAIVLLVVTIVKWPVYLFFSVITPVIIIGFPLILSDDKQIHKILRISIGVFFIILYTLMFGLNASINDIHEATVSILNYIKTGY